MNGVIEGFVVIGLVIVVGYLLGRSGALGPAAVDVLSRVAFFVATPALLFVTLAHADVGAVFSEALVVTAVSSSVACLLYLPVGLLRGRPAGETAVGSMASGYVNAGNLGIPIATYALGNAAEVAPVMLFQLTVLAPLFSTVLDLTSSRVAGERPPLLRTVTAPVRNPIALASGAGLAVSATGVQLPESVLAPVELIGNLAVPAMLLAFGLSLRGAARPGHREQRRRTVATTLVGVPVPGPVSLLRNSSDIGHGAATSTTARVPGGRQDVQEEPMTTSVRAVHPWIAAGAEHVRFGILRFPVSDLAALQGEMRYLESAGFDGVYMPDHPTVAPDPWVGFAAAASATTTLRLGVLVSCVAYRHPAMLARAVADVDALSGGRVVLGLGSGNLPGEFDMLGLAYGTSTDRRALLGRMLTVLPPLLRGEPVTAEGPGFALRDAVLPAPALQQPGVPILVAGGSRGMLRLAAEHADAVNLAAAAWGGGAYSNADVEHRLGLLDEFCAAAGRPPESVLRTGLLGISVAPTRDAAQAAVDAVPAAFQEMLRGFFVAGTPDDVVRHINGVIDSGYRYLVFFMADILSGSRAMTDRLVAEVLPRVDRPAASLAAT